MTNPMHEAVTLANATLIALDDKGEPIKGAPRITTKPDHWNDGHPHGALLEKSFDFDAVRLTAPMRIAGWQVLDSARKAVGSFVASTVTVIEPGTLVTLSRVVLVPRDPSET